MARSTTTTTNKTKNTRNPLAMAETNYIEQIKRQRVSPDWQPRGFERYQYQKALLDAMPVLDVVDGLLVDATRYREAQSCMETLDCHCGE